MVFTSSFPVSPTNWAGRSWILLAKGLSQSPEGNNLIFLVYGVVSPDLKVSFVSDTAVSSFFSEIYFRKFV